MTILTQVLEEMKQEKGENFSLKTVNLAELQRRTGISRKRLRNLQKHDFKEIPHGRKGKKSSETVLTGYTGIIDDLLRKGVYNSSVTYDRIREVGYKGSLTQVKLYLNQHKDLLPAKRQVVSPQGNRGRRYSTGPGEAFQMDWGFVNVQCMDGTTFQVACFAMICHHCGERYVEFFPNAKQENLFIGMLHAFSNMGVPTHVLTDNMKSVVIRRDSNGRPIWQHDYEAFMRTVGFETRLCKPRHPFTKGAVERLVRYVKDNFIAGRSFWNLSDLNEAALEWCNRQNSIYHRALDCVPAQVHLNSCAGIVQKLDKTMEIAAYLCPVRKISFDGFINFEGRRFGVPYWYTEHACRVKRERDTLYILDLGLTQILTSHPVTWSKKDQFCRDQYLDEQPKELPTAPVKAVIQQLEPPRRASGFSKFNFDPEED